MFDFSAERTLQSVEESLKRLGLEYIDVIQVQKNLGFPPLYPQVGSIITVVNSNITSLPVLCC